MARKSKGFPAGVPLSETATSTSTELSASQRARRKPRSVLLVIGVVAAVLGSLLLPTSVGPAAASSEKCQDLNTLFFEEYWPGVRWGRPGQSTTITWSISAPVIQGRAPYADERVLRPFSAEEQIWIGRAVNAWDEALSTVAFRRVDGSAANVTIGLVEMRDRPGPGWWFGWTNGERRTKATIGLQLSSTLDGRDMSDEAGFTHVVLHELGNILGLGDIAWDTLRERSPGATSVMLDPRRAPLAQIPLSDFDRNLIQQVYGENGCPSGSPTSPPSGASSSAKSSIRNGATNTVVDPNSCWSSKNRPILQIKIDGKWQTLARGKLVRNKVCADEFKAFPYAARFQFAFKKPVPAGRYEFRAIDRRANLSPGTFRLSVS